MVVSSPSIVNDGRRLIIASQPVSYLAKNVPQDGFDFLPANDAIEFTDFFKKQNASNTKFSSIMRMNSTFPYVLPAVCLPSEPVIKVMDAGLRDNFGTKNALRFLFVGRFVQFGQAVGRTITVVAHTKSLVHAAKHAQPG